MRNQRFIWIFGLLGTGFIVVSTLLLLATPNADAAADPWTNVPVRTSSHRP